MIGGGIALSQATESAPVIEDSLEIGGGESHNVIWSGLTRLNPVGPLIDGYRSVEKQLAKNPAMRAMRAVPDTGVFVARTFWKNRFADPIPGFPTTPLTPGVIASVAADEALLNVFMGPNRFPRRADYERVGLELAEAQEMFSGRGWLDDPVSYHVEPPALKQPQMSGGWANGQAYTRLVWTSDYEPHEGEPGRDRWLDIATNRVAGGWMLRHDDDIRRPWLVVLHGLGCGYAFMDFPAFHAPHLHQHLGVNVLGVTLPLHGRRKPTRMSGSEFLSFDVMDTVHGMAQALWDTRRIIGWLRDQDDGPIGVAGVSLGGYAAAMMAAFDPDLAAVIAGIPVTDFLALFRAQSPPHIMERAEEHGIMGGPGETVQRVISPLAMQPVVNRDRRYIFAGLGDRVAHPRQAFDLWKHWDEPSVLWFKGNHVSYLMNRQVKGFQEKVLRESGLWMDPKA